MNFVIRYLLFLFYFELNCVIGHPLVDNLEDDTVRTVNQRSLASDTATYLLVPVAVVIGAEGAIMGATGVTFGDGIQSVGAGLKAVGDEIKGAGDEFTNLSRGLKGLSSVIYSWGAGSQLPIIGKDSDITDALSAISKLSPEFSQKLLNIYFHQMNADDDDEDTGDDDDEEIV